MYNLFVSANPDAWAGEPWEIDLTRVVREYTADALTEKFGSLNDEAIEALMRFPCLFAYEAYNNRPARIGWITRIRHRNRMVRDCVFSWITALAAG
jgi:hypothetical protein